jgi:hypothetical protein
MYVIDWWSSLEGEQFLDDQEYYFEPDQQYHPESFDKGKYNMRLSLLPIYWNYHIYACVLLDNHRDYNLAIDSCFLVTYGLCIWVAIASA